MNDREKTFDKQFRKVFAVFLLLVFAVLFLPYLFTHYSVIDLTEYGPLGTTIGGILGPFIAILAAGLTFMAFWVQFKANERQRNDIKRERAQTKFYELLRLHKANVNEIEVNNKRGREAFIELYNQLEKVYKEAKKFYGKSKRKISSQDQISSDKAKFKLLREESFISAAYFIAFFGFSSCQSFVKKGRYPKGVSQRFFRGFLKHYEKLDSEGAAKGWMRSPTRFQFTGDVSKLGHYYRHLYQMIKFVTTERDLILNWNDPGDRENEQYQYIKTIRAQLSNHEQALIYYNSFFSRVWWEEEKDSEGNPLIENQFGQSLSYFLDFAFIKNLPFNLTDDMGPNPQELFHQKLTEREYAEGFKGKKPELTIDEKLDWLFEWRGG